MSANENYIATDFANRWLFRWRFDFLGHKASRIGGWFPATRLEDMASTVNKEGLAWASVEGKHFITKEVKVFAQSRGEDFINFQHLVLYISSNGRATQRTYGMRLVHRYGIFNCYETGTIEEERRGGTDQYPEWTRV